MNFLLDLIDGLGQIGGISEKFGTPMGNALATRYQIDPEVNYKAELLRDKIAKGHITSDTDALIQLNSSPGDKPFFDRRTGLRFIPSTMAIPKEGGGWLENVAPEVLGVQAKPNLTKEYDIKNEAVQAPVDPYMAIRALAGDTQPIQDIVAPNDVVERYVANAMKYAGTPMPDANKYPFRQPDTMAENAKYVGDYVRAAMTLAPYVDLPPKTIASMLMQESGWGGQRFDGNLGGYGFLDSGQDLGIRFPGNTPAEQAWGYLNKVASDWDGRYRGSRSPEDFHLRGYNPHETYPAEIYGIMRMLEAQ